MAKNYDYDIVIVGGGPAGLSAAWSAAKKGLRVAVLERDEAKSFGIPPECYNEISNYAFYSPNNYVIKKSETAQAAVLDVRKTYQFLAYQAASVGADIFLRTTVTDVVKNDKGKLAGVKATSEKQEVVFNSKLVIDASGFYSVVGRSLGIALPWKRFGAGE